MPHVLITGAAGFIGSHLTESLLSREWHVTGVDNFDPFYPRAAKERNLEAVASHPKFRFLEADIRDLNVTQPLAGPFDAIVHLAAKAGVRQSIVDPIGTQNTNVSATHALLELAKAWGVPHFVFASSSSVYGINPNVPWSEEDHVLLPISPYASTKVSAELLGHVYHHLFGIRFLALRFFTVYGPRQRPDLAIHKFSRLMAEGRPIPVFGDGATRRDYTFVGDIVSGIVSALDYRDTGYEVINLGNSRTVSLLELIASLERSTGIKAQIDWRSTQPGDVPQTFADIRKAKALLAYDPKTTLDHGLNQFWEWFQRTNRV